jgi:hypothetical protein
MIFVLISFLGNYLGCEFPFLENIYKQAGLFSCLLSTRRTSQMGKKTKKENEVYELMLTQACIIAKLPPPQVDFLNKSFLHKNLKNTCMCHEFKSSSDKPQAKLNMKEREDTKHDCLGSCPGFHLCHFVQVCCMHVYVRTCTITLMSQTGA